MHFWMPASAGMTAKRNEHGLNNQRELDPVNCVSIKSISWIPSFASSELKDADMLMKGCPGLLRLYACRLRDFPVALDLTR